MLKIADQSHEDATSPAAWSSSSRTRVVFGGGVGGGGGGFAAHVAAVRVSRLHELVPETVYPESHVGWHVDPLARELVQSPAPPFVGAADASHVEDEVQMFPPPETVAASLVPSLEEVMSHHPCEVAREVQVAPESVEVQMFPPLTTAASLVPSLEEVM